jgi:hypothetical protein
MCEYLWHLTVVGGMGRRGRGAVGRASNSVSPRLTAVFRATRARAKSGWIFFSLVSCSYQSFASVSSSYLDCGEGETPKIEPGWILRMDLRDESPNVGVPRLFMESGQIFPSLLYFLHES